jgi:acetoacetyl-CoA synthetase
VVSASGGTDVVGAFALGSPIQAVVPGEISGPALGVALDAYDEAGRSVRATMGELVVTRPYPSMPVGFWDDADGARYRAAYFEYFPGVWRHGDWVTLTERGTVVIHGRSDATLNRNGVRMGSADIYEVVEALPEIDEALVIGAEEPDGGYWMPLFVVLADGAVLDDGLRRRIVDALRTGVSPRHVPDEIVAVPGVPHTRTGKKLEVPVKRLLQGVPADEVRNGAVAEAELLDLYAELGARRRAGLAVR